MESPTQKNLLLEIAETNGEIIYQENKTLAKLSWLRSWDKNPRTAEKKDLTKLENQIEELGVYKPLVVYLEKDNATILGGNMRYRVLKELRKKHEALKSDKYEYVWVSVVNAVNDVDKLKYALSDNFSAGTYSRDKLKEIVNVEQGSLFSDYQLEYSEKQEINDFIEQMGKTDEEIKSEGLAKQLKAAGVEADTIDDILDMTNFGKVESKYNPQKLVGTGAIEFKDRKIFVMKLVFGESEEALYKNLLEIFNNGANMFKEQGGELYQNLISVYGKGSGDVLVKTLHLLSNLPTSEEFRNWQADYKKCEAEKVKQMESVEDFFAGGRETLID